MGAEAYSNIYTTIQNFVNKLIVSFKKKKKKTIFETYALFFSSLSWK